jgi:hypothetical protein
LPVPIGPLGAADSIEEWASRYLDAAVCGVRSVEVAGKIALHLVRFRDHFADATVTSASLRWSAARSSPG